MHLKQLIYSSLNSSLYVLVYALGLAGAPFFPGLFLGFSILALIYGENKEGLWVTINK